MTSLVLFGIDHRCRQRLLVGLSLEDFFLDRAGGQETVDEAWSRGFSAMIAMKQGREIEPT